ncbi:putative receptor-like protein kinase At3g47110 [Rhododendron vialii]|uniref:putative receptor-like protein kinase At3g47110 n=1 Tax=Rhododendron vialii TaxID=182163 RepID=UPI00265EA168|nr:putative receptor-like protein kinase At3g47110 [Rhododendron vialii]
MKMSPVTKSLSIDLLALFLSLIPFLQNRALALDTTSSLSLINTINVARNETDFHALLAFMSNIFPQYHQALSSWNESLHFCHWEGVKCGCRHERVTVIDLASRGLAGSLSPYIGNLSFLRELSLINNTFIGEIPTELGNLLKLQILKLAYNGFEGKIPTSLSRCSNLGFLSVTSNKLVGEFPKELGYSMPRLKSLYVTSNNLTGGIPPSIGILLLRNLELLGLEDNQFGGELPNFITMNDENNLNGSIPRQLLMQNSFQGSIPSSMESLRGIQNLDLSHNNLSGQILGFLGTFSLKNLNLSFNNFEGELPMRGVFTNASAISVAGNYRLCGGILELLLA